VTTKDIEQIRNPVILYYQQVLHKDSERENLESNVKTRLGLELQPYEYYPLPSFYCEKRILLGVNSPLNLSFYLCQHSNLILSYNDIYPAKKYKKLLYEAERKLIEQKKTLILERSMLREDKTTYNKVLLSCTMLPKPIVDYVLDYDKESKRHYKDFLDAFIGKKCSVCLDTYNRIKRRRVVEQYLFLKYQAAPVDASDTSVSKVWVNAWVEYLFYDTELYLENTLTKNFCLPHPPIKYNFAIRVGDQVQKINRQICHILFAIYGEDSQLREVLDDIDNQLLANCLADSNSEDVLQTLGVICEALVKKKLKESKQQNYHDEWFDFQEEENAYEVTLDKEDDQSAFILKPPRTVSTLVRKHSLLELRDAGGPKNLPQSDEEEEDKQAGEALDAALSTLQLKQKLSSRQHDESKNGHSQDFASNFTLGQPNSKPKEPGQHIFLPVQTVESIQHEDK